jgi:hypothetical protein
LVAEDPVFYKARELLGAVQILQGKQHHLLGFGVGRAIIVRLVARKAVPERKGCGVLHSSDHQGISVLAQPQHYPPGSEA